MCKSAIIKIYLNSLAPFRDFCYISVGQNKSGADENLQVPTKSDESAVCVLIAAAATPAPHQYNPKLKIANCR